MNNFFLSVLIVLGTSSLLANPIAIDSSRRPIAMTAEKVLISVSSGKSQVQGTYTFHQDKDNWPEEADTHVIIFVPVLLPNHERDAPSPPPTILLGRKKFMGHIRNDISLEGTPHSGGKLPKGWYMAIYEASIPLKLLDETFSIGVSYTQPHFEGDISGYVPINPPKSRGASIITFRATPGCALKQVKVSLFRHDSYPMIVFTPEDRQLIRVRSVKQREPAGATQNDRQ